MTQRIYKHPAESLVYLFDFTRKLATGDVLVVDGPGGLPSVDETSGATGLTIDPSPAINTGDVTEDGKTVAANKGVQVRISAGDAGKNYVLLATSKTNDGDTLTVEGILTIS